MGEKLRHHVTMNEIWEAIYLYWETKGFKINKFSYWVRNRNTDNVNDMYIDIQYPSDSLEEFEPLDFKNAKALADTNKKLKNEIKELKKKLNKFPAVDKADKAIDEMLGSKPESPSEARKIDLHKLKNIVKSTVELSDVFVSESKEDRKLILRELEILCEKPNSTIDDLKEIAQLIVND